MDALSSNTSGNYNTALGIYALRYNTTGGFNTAIGYNANTGSENLTNAVAIGSNALVESSNSLVLGSINGVNYATASTKVGIGTTSPDASAALDITSTTRGFLPPRMTLAQRDAIVSPAAGLIVWCSNCNVAGELQLFNGTTWTNISGGTASGIVASLSPTAEPGSITSNTAISGGEVASDNGSAITARGICWGTAHDPTTDLSTKTEEAGTTGSFTSNLTNLNASTTYYIRSYAVNSGGTAYGTEVSLTTSPFTCGTSTITVNHVASGGVAPEDKTVTYGTVINTHAATTYCWITRNLGASRPAVGKDDDTDASAGWYWQFNRKQGYKHLDRFRTPSSTWDPTNENFDWFESRDPCRLELGNGWRVPTDNDWIYVEGSGSWENWNDVWDSHLKLHAAGYLSNTDGALLYRGSDGRYWSTHSLGNGAYHLKFAINYCLVDDDFKAYAFSLRCIKD